MKAIGHVFYQTHLGSSHAGLDALLRKKVSGGLKDGECAVFINKPMTAVKILISNELLLYYRSTPVLTSALIKNLPTMLGGKAFGFSGSTQAKLIRALEEHFPQKNQAKAVYA